MNPSLCGTGAGTASSFAWPWAGALQRCWIRVPAASTGWTATAQHVPAGQVSVSRPARGALVVSPLCVAKCGCWQQGSLSLGRGLGKAPSLHCCGSRCVSSAGLHGAWAGCPHWWHSGASSGLKLTVKCYLKHSKKLLHSQTLLQTWGHRVLGEHKSEEIDYLCYWNHGDSSFAWWWTHPSAGTSSESLFRTCSVNLLLVSKELKRVCFKKVRVLRPGKCFSSCWIKDLGLLHTALVQGCTGFWLTRWQPKDPPRKLQNCHLLQVPVLLVSCLSLMVEVQCTENKQDIECKWLADILGF